MLTKVTYKTQGRIESVVIKCRTPGSAFATFCLLHPDLSDSTFISAITIEQRSPESSFFKEGEKSNH